MDNPLPEVAGNPLPTEVEDSLGRCRLAEGDDSSCPADPPGVSWVALRVTKKKPSWFPITFSLPVIYREIDRERERFFFFESQGKSQRDIKVMGKN